MKNIHLTFGKFLSNWLQIGFTNLYPYLWYVKKLVSCIFTNALYSISQSKGNKHYFKLYFLDFSKVIFAFLDHKTSSSLNCFFTSFVFVLYSVLYFFSYQILKPFKKQYFLILKSFVC